MELLGRWVVGLAGAALCCGLALSLTPRGRVHRVLRLVCGMVMVIALISPLMDIDIGELSVNSAYYRERLGDLQGRTQETSDRLSRTIIEEECAAYILDKAQVIGLDIQAVSVTAKWGDEGWFYPCEAHITANGGSEEQRGRLAAFIEGELGIERERQYWDGKEDVVSE